MIDVSQTEFNGPPAVRVVRPSSARVWGITATERLRRAFHRCGLDNLESVAVPPAPGSTIVVRGDYVLDEALVRGLIADRDVVLVSGDTAIAAHVGREALTRVAAALERRESPAAPAFVGLRALGPAEVAGAANQALRKRQPPVVLALDAHAASEVEWQLFRSAYKGITDVVTKWVWPRPAFWVTRWCAERGVTPNQVTAVSLVLVLVAFACFRAGSFAVGLLAAWGMTFLDTVDGKLARVTLTSSPLGNVFDHGIDLLHPPFWYWAWHQGVHASTFSPSTLDTAMWIVVIGYVVGRLLEGVFLAAFKFEAHAWRPIDSLFRQITARRNPNLLLLTASAVAGRADIGLLAVAAWTLVSLLFHAVRVAQALALRLGGTPPASWLDSSEPLTGISRWAA